MNIITKLTAATALTIALGAMPALAQTSQPFQPTGSTQSDRVLTEAEINELVNKAQRAGYNASSSGADVRYLGGSNIAVETNLCCENVVEEVTTRTEVEEVTVPVDVVTERNIVTPTRVKTIQPVEVRRAVGRVETVTEDTTYVENRLPVRIERDDVPELKITTNERLNVETREEVNETTYSVVGERRVVQPVNRTTVVPVQRRITRNVNDVQTLPTRYERVVAPVRQNAVQIPTTVETYSTPTEEEYVEDITTTNVDYVERRDIYRNEVQTDIQPVERQILNPTTDYVTGETIYREEYLAARVETIPANAVQEVIIPQISEETVFEVEDVIYEQINRTLIQPVVITTVQPVETQFINGRQETVMNDTVYRENRLPLQVRADPIPETIVNIIPNVTREYREEYFETSFDAPTERIVTQDINVTRIQPVEIRRPVYRTETVTEPTRYETVRASMVVLNVGEACNCEIN